VNEVIEMRNVDNSSMLKRVGRILLPFAAVLMLIFCAPGSKTRAQTTQQANKQAVTTVGHDHAGEAARNAFPDVEAMDQDGRPLHFYSDLIKGKKVIVNFIFTSCTYICPLQGANFSKIQAALGDRLGKDVSLVSVSIDPLTDTPQQLKSWGEKFGRREGWTFVTGKKTEIDKLLRALTGDPSGVTEHSAIAFIGDYDQGVWIRADALDDPVRLIGALDNVLRRNVSR
jgi:cytochrome oxidase Cu insertion factor (SCO1/SenC/PrrC family)